MSLGWLTLILVIARISGFMVTAPFFSRKEIPAQLKISFVIVMSLMVFPLIEGVTWDVDMFLNHILLETMLGLLMGSAASIVFMGIQGAGHFLDQQGGFAMATVFDPNAGQVSLLARLFSMLGVMLFLALDGHRTIIQITIAGFYLVPPGLASYDASILQIALYSFSASVLFVLRFAVPVATVLFITDLLLGMVGKTVPQLNVLMMAMPVKALLASLILMLTLPIYVRLTDALTNDITQVLIQMLEAGAL